ncbi:MAG: ATP-dependent metalloprotease FtsH [Bacteroidetes bacterium]|jgi:cell division protease FtsH|nr:ATP-dependent metalloprotease FtsH [Bacteroidota bacterium]
MSEENKDSADGSKTPNDQNNQDEQRKQQFEKMRERFAKKNGNQPGGGPPKNSFNFYWIYAVVVIGLLAFTMFGGGFSQTRLKPMEQAEFNNYLSKGWIKNVVIVNDEVAEITVYSDSLRAQGTPAPVTKSPQAKKDLEPQYHLNFASKDIFINEMKEAQKNNPESSKIWATRITRTDWSDHLFSWILPIGLMILLWIIIMRRMSGPGGGGQLFNIGRSKAVLFDKDTNVQITFNDVAGLEEAKVEIKEIVDFLKNPKKYTELGAKIPKGALLVGPPGTGKTLIAKAVAGEAKVPFFSLSGSDFVEMFVGVGASRVRDLFRQAKEKAPCIVFIDEIDAIGRARGKNISQGANDERENTLNQLLTEMDGFGTNSGVIILAATNRADILDKALLRPGRFDRQIFVDLPDVNERKEIFVVHLKPLKLDNSIDVDFLARQTPGFSGADIANICNEAALIAARNNKKVIDKQDFLDAVDRIIGGLEKKNKIITPHEKRVIAFHESGHATVSWLVEHAHPLVKVTIVPRGRSLGAAWYLPDERQITTREQIMDEMCAALGGRAAEELIFGQVSTGALSDLEKITKQAYASIVYYGLNDKIGNVSYYDSSGQSEYTFGKPYSERQAEIIDQEVKKMIDEAYFRTKEILMNNKDKLSLLAEKLLEREVIFRDDLEIIFGKRPFDKEEVAGITEIVPNPNNPITPIT